MDPSNHSNCFTLKLVVLSAPLGTFGREVSGKPMAAGSVSPLSTITISSSPVPWWCCWPLFCTFCEFTEFTADKLEPWLLWTCCGLNRWSREAGPETETLQNLRTCCFLNSSTFINWPQMLLWPGNFYFFTLIFFLVPRTGPFLRSRNVICEDLSGERPVLTQGTKLSPSEACFSFITKSWYVSGCSISPSC